MVLTVALYSSNLMQLATYHKSELHKLLIIGFRDIGQSAVRLQAQDDVPCVRQSNGRSRRMEDR